MMPLPRFLVSGRLVALNRPRDRQPEPSRQMVAHVKFAMLDYLFALAFGQTREAFAIKGLSKEIRKSKHTVIETVGIDLARGVIGIG